MQTDVWEHRVLLFLIVCHGVLLWRLWSQKLAGVYLFLTIFLAGEMVQDLVGFPVPQDSRLYAWLFLYSSAALWLFAYFVVLELYRLILEDYPGIASVGRKAAVFAGVILLGGAALLSSQGEARMQLEAVDSSSDRLRLQRQLTDMNRLLSRAARGRG
jgi:hypothetical protein